MWFWIKNIFLTVFLIAAAVFLLTDQSKLFEEQLEILRRPPAEQGQKKPQAKTSEDQQGSFSGTTSGAAAGLSNFYGKVKEDLLGNSNKLGDGFVLKLKKPNITIDQQLQNRARMVTPGNPKFEGEFVDRRFRSGDTVKDKLSEYAEDEGIELFWRLERDYIIKHNFQVSSSFVEALGSVAKAIDSDFERDVYAYYCSRERAAIVTYETSDYMSSNCKLADSKNQRNN